MARKQTEAMSYGIIGLGRFGSALAATLAEADKELMVLDRSEEKIRQARNYKIGRASCRERVSSPV